MQLLYGNTVWYLSVCLPCSSLNPGPCRGDKYFSEELTKGTCVAKQFPSLYFSSRVSFLFSMMKMSCWLPNLMWFSWHFTPSQTVSAGMSAQRHGGKCLAFFD